MLDAFASVGATRFDVTWTTCAGEKEWFRRGMSFDDLGRNLPRMLDEAPSKQRKVIVRPHGHAVTFIPTRRPRPGHARPSRPHVLAASPIDGFNSLKTVDYCPEIQDLCTALTTSIRSIAQRVQNSG